MGTVIKMGRGMSAQDRNDEAIREYEAALALRTDSPQSHYDLGVAFQQAGRIKEARKEFEETLKIDPHFAPALRALESFPQ